MAKTILLAFSILFIFGQQTQALPRQCINGLDPYRSAEVRPESLRVDREPLALGAEALNVVNEHELSIYKERLDAIRGAHGQVLTTAALKEFYESQYFPNALIAPRLEMARNGITKDNILSILGDLSNRETLRLFVGDHYDQVLPDSLVGRYLAETGALLQRRSHKEIGTMVPGQRPRRGPSRLIVPIDEGSMQTFLKYFSNQQAYSVIGHGNLVWRGKILYQTNNMAELEFRKPSVNTPLPMVLLKTTEGQRLQRYIGAFQNMALGLPIAHNFGAQGWDNPARAPWAYIPAVGGGRYMDTGSRYNCCVHWQGNMPIGDRLVTEITLPKSADPDRWDSRDIPNVVQLHPPDYSDPGLTPVRNVWTYPLHEPVSAMLGLANNNGAGEFASAGWVIQTLMVSAPMDRVPFIFQFVKDRRARIGVRTVLDFEGP